MEIDIFAQGLVAFVVLGIYSAMIAFTFMSDNPNAPDLTWFSFLKRAIAVPTVIAAIIGTIYGLGLLVNWII